VIEKLVRPRGFEPLASCSGGKRSIQLSYGRISVGVLRGPSRPVLICEGKSNRTVCFFNRIIDPCPPNH
jgi:hypothetical protein